MAWKAEKFTKSALEAFGMSELSAKKTSGTYMTMAKSAGINENAASDMAVTLAGLTGDVASFYNISQNLADVRLKSVFTEKEIPSLVICMSFICLLVILVSGSVYSP